MTNTLTRAGLARAAELLRAGADGIALLRTVMAVECRGSGFDRRGRVLILYEPHIAWREASEPVRTRLAARGLAYPKWGQRPYPKDSYPSFTAAADINREIACRACSWGLGQLLGTNHKAAGYPSAAAMASAFAGGEDEQAAAMARFIVANPAMHRALLAHDWAGFASRYNGPGLSAEDDRRLQRLADFAALSLLDPQRLAELRGQPQHEVPPYKLVWLLPFLDLYPQHALALRLQASAGPAATAYGQIGGRLAPLYPHVAR